MLALNAEIYKYKNGDRFAKNQLRSSFDYYNYEKLVHSVKNIAKIYPKIIIFEKISKDMISYVQDLESIFGIPQMYCLNYFRTNEKNKKKKTGNSYVVQADFFDKLMSYYRARVLPMNFHPTNYALGRWIKTRLSGLRRFKTDKSIAIELSQDMRKKILQKYEEPNKALSEFYNLNLSEYGYYD